MNHFHNILVIRPKRAIAVSQQDARLYWVKKKKECCYSFLNGLE